MLFVKLKTVETAEYLKALMFMFQKIMWCLQTDFRILRQENMQGLFTAEVLWKHIL